jgi:hypothetical protein
MGVGYHSAENASGSREHSLLLRSPGSNVARLLAFLLLALVLASIVAAQGSKTFSGSVRLTAMDSDHANISVIPCDSRESVPSETTCKGEAAQVKVTAPALRTKLEKFATEDYLRVSIDNGELKDIFGSVLAPANGVIPARDRILSLVGWALAILGLAAAVTKGAPRKFIIGMDNRYSNSKFQLALWFWVLLSSYLSTVFLRLCYAHWNFLGGVDIPQNLLLLSGMSALTYGGAKAITTAKVEAAQNPVPPAPNAVAPPPNPNPKNTLVPGQESFFRDLVQDDFGHFDFGDFQMLVFTFTAVGVYALLVYHFLATISFVKTTSLPDVDTTLLASFGLGQGAYLAKKAGGDVGKS